MHKLTSEDVDAINRLLTWKHETEAEGVEATVELRTRTRASTGECLFVATAMRGAHDELYLSDYEPTISAAVDKVLARMAAAVDELTRAHDTIPSNPRPSSTPPAAVQDWSDL